MVEAGILVEVTGNARNRAFNYSRCTRLLSDQGSWTLPGVELKILIKSVRPFILVEFAPDHHFEFIDYVRSAPIVNISSVSAACFIMPIVV